MVINTLHLDKVIIAVLIILVVGSCTNDERIEEPLDYSGWGIDSVATEKGDNYEISYQFKDNVTVLDNRLIKFLAKVVDDSILYFKKDMPDSIRPQIGSIYSARVTEQTPYGLGNIVLSKTEEDGLIRCVTSVAPLDDIFEVLDMKVNLSVADFVNDDGGIYDEDGIFYEVSVACFDDLDWGEDSLKARTRWQIGSPKVLIIPIKKARNNENGFFGDINLALGGILKMEKNMNLGTYDNSIELFAGVKGRIGFIYEKDKNGTPHPFVIKILQKIPIFSNIIMVGPVVLRPSLWSDISFKGKAIGTAAIGFGYRGNAKFGINESELICENNFKKVPLENLFSSFELNGKAQIGPEIALEASVGLYTSKLAITLRPSVWFSVGGELDFDIEKEAGNKRKVEADAAATFDVEGGFEGAIVADLFGKKKEIGTSAIKDMTWNLWNTSVPIFPKLDYSSFNVEVRKDYSPLTFDAKYEVTGGLIAKLMGGKLALRVEGKDGEVFTIPSYNEILYTTPTIANFELKNLEEGVVYKAIPCVLFDNVQYEWMEKKFTSKGAAAEKQDLSGTWECIEYADDGSVFEESVLILNSDNSATMTSVSGNALFTTSEEGRWRIDEDEKIQIRFDKTYSQGWMVKTFYGVADDIFSASKIEGTATRSRASYSGRQWDYTYKFVMTK